MYAFSHFFLLKWKKKIILLLTRAVAQFSLEEDMRKVMKRTTVAALAGVMAVGMLSGCGEKKLDGTKKVEIGRASCRERV